MSEELGHYYSFWRKPDASRGLLIVFYSAILGLGLAGYELCVDIDNHHFVWRHLIQLASYGAFILYYIWLCRAWKKKLMKERSEEHKRNSHVT